MDHGTNDDLDTILNHLRYGNCTDCITVAQKVSNLARREERHFVGITYFHIALMYLCITGFFFVLMLGGQGSIKPPQVFGLAAITVGVFMLHKWMRIQRVS
jgi:hypothetical protein